MTYQWSRRLGRSIGAFLWPATGSAIVASVVYALDPGSFATGGGRPLPTLLTLYFGLAVVCGSLYGLLSSWATTPIRRGAVAAFVAWPAVIALGFLNDSLQISRLSLDEIWIAGAIAVVMGPLVAVGLHAASLKPGTVEALRAKDAARRRLPWLVAGLIASLAGLLLIY